MPSSIKFYCFYLFAGILVFTLNLSVGESDRKLSQELNPGCNATCGKLIVIKAISSTDMLYYLWDFGHKPTFLIAEVPLHTELEINWKNFTFYDEESIRFSNIPSYMFGIVINKIYEFNDKSDTGILKPDNNETVAFKTEDFNWSILGLLDDVSNNRIAYSIGANRYNDKPIGSINITSYVYGSIGHADSLPHLLHTENSSQIEFVLDHFKTSFTNSRFAIEFITFSSNEKNSRMKLSAKKTLDDENAPGVFTLDTLVVEDPRTEDPSKSGFLQWRPIVYTSYDKVVANSTKTIEYELANVSNALATFNSSLLYAFYGNFTSEFLLKAENVSFGSSKDGFYPKTNYMSWSFVLGVGSPPENPFSMLVFLILAIGLGLPTLIIMGGTAFIIYKKIRSRE